MFTKEQNRKTTLHRILCGGEWSGWCPPSWGQCDPSTSLPQSLCLPPPHPPQLRSCLQGPDRSQTCKGQSQGLYCTVLHCTVQGCTVQLTLAVPR